MIRNPRSYIDDLHHPRERLQKQASLLFVKDHQKIALEILSHCDDGDNRLPLINTEWTNIGQIAYLFTDALSRRSLAYGRN